MVGAMKEIEVFGGLPVVIKAWTTTHLAVGYLAIASSRVEEFISDAYVLSDFLSLCLKQHPLRGMCRNSFFEAAH